MGAGYATSHSQGCQANTLLNSLMAVASKDKKKSLRMVLQKAY